MVQKQQHVRIFRNGRNQAVRIPREFEIECNEAIISKEGNRLILTPVKKSGLLSVLSALKPIDETFPDVDEKLMPLDDLHL